MEGPRRLKIFCGVGLLVAVRKHLRLIPLCGTQPRSNRNAVAVFSPALERMLAVRKHLRWVTM
jgi:hypothetical protein